MFIFTRNTSKMTKSVRLCHLVIHREQSKMLKTFKGKWCDRENLLHFLFRKKCGSSKLNWLLFELENNEDHYMKVGWRSFSIRPQPLCNKKKKKKKKYPLSPYYLWFFLSGTCLLETTHRGCCICVTDSYLLQKEVFPERSSLSTVSKD